MVTSPQPHSRNFSARSAAAAFLAAVGCLLIAPAAALGAAPARPVQAPSGPHDIERYLNIRSSNNAGLSPDGGTVAFLTNVTGTQQIWTVPAAGGWPEQITFFNDAVSAVEWSSRENWIAFSKDDGGDENYQLFLVSPDGGDLVQLTRDPAVRHNFGSWSLDGRLIAYSSNERDRRFFDVYVLEIGNGRKNRVAEMDARLYAGPFSNDGKRLVVARSNGSLDDDLFVVDLDKDGAATPRTPVHLTPHEGKASYRPVGFAADDRSVLVVSDAGREFFALGRIDLATRAIAWERGLSWDVDSAALSPDGGTLALVVNEDGYDRLHLIDTAGMKDLPVPAIPPGQIDGLAFSRDGKRLTLTQNGPTRNGNVWRLDLERAGGGPAAFTQVTRSSTAGIPPSSFVEPRLVRYRTFDGLEIPSFFYLPKGARKGDTRPAIVIPHGGPEGQTITRFSPVIQYYVDRGYAVWAPNVRGSTGYGRTFTHLDDVRHREDSVKDLAAGVDWLVASGQINPKQIAVVGGSYGGYMTLAAITLYPDLWAAAVSSYGIANFRTFFGNTASYRVSHRASEYGDPIKDGDFLDSISPIHRADRIRSPLLILQGAKDPRVPQIESEQIVAAVKKKGGVAEYVLFPDEGHGWTKLPNQIRAYRATADFLDRHVKGTTSQAGSDPRGGAAPGR
jgi:dipeptidyl aminopeptidase/acylaminoacyl peptidase